MEDRIDEAINGFLITIHHQIINLLSEACNQSDLTIWNAHLAIKLIIFKIFNPTNECDDIETISEISNLVNQLSPVSFRIELIENLFSLLFLTRDLILADADLNEDKENPKPRPFFLFPNYLVADYLTMLKECALEAQTKLFQLKRRPKEAIIDLNTTVNQPDVQNQNYNLKSSITTYDECRLRLRKLMDYINDALWRYSVVELSFYVDNINVSVDTNAAKESFLSTKSNYDCDQELLSDSDSGDNDSFVMEFNMNNSSFCFISYMLASAQQLLRYCLLKDKLDRAKQVQKLFESDLIASKESCELLIIVKMKELTYKITASSKQSRRLSASWLPGSDTLTKGLKSNNIQSILSEFSQDIESQAQAKVNINQLLVDYAVCISPALEVSACILENSLRLFANQSYNCPKVQASINSLLSTIVKIVTTFKDHPSYKQLNLPKILAYSIDSNLFNNPINQIALVDKVESIRNAINDLKVILGDDSNILQCGTTLQSTHNKYDSRTLTLKYQKLISNFPSGRFNYLKALFYHVRKVSEVLIKARKRTENFARNLTDKSLTQSMDKSNISPLIPEGAYFSVLYTSPSAILCSMVLKYGISPKIVDDLARDMKVDLLGTLCSVTCPYIPASSKQDEDFYDFTLIDSFHPALCELIHCYLTGSVDMNTSVMIQNHFDDERPSNEGESRPSIKNSELADYFRKKSWILANLLKILDLIDCPEEDDMNSRIFDPQSPLQKWITIVKTTLTTNSREDPYSVIALAFYSRIPINHSLIMRALERCAVNQDYLKIHQILRLLDLKNRNSSLEALQTALLLKLTKKTGDIKYALQMSCARTMRDLVVEMIFTSSSSSSPAYLNEENAILTLKSALSRIQRNPDQTGHHLVQETLEKTIKVVRLYTKIAALSGLKSWRDAYENLSQIDIFKVIRSKKNYHIIWDWLEFIQEPRITFLPKALIMSDDLNDAGIVMQNELNLLALCSQDSSTKTSSCQQKIATTIEKDSILQFLESLQNPCDVVDKVLPDVEDFSIRERLIQFILDTQDNNLKRETIDYYKNYLQGIQLIQILPTTTRPHYESLVTKPLLLIEQMLMNLEFEPLEESIKTLQTVNFDHLVEIYARKAVDVEIIDSESISGSDTTMISSSIFTDMGVNVSFRMPTTVPSKEQWVPDYKVSACMLCKLEKFSMFNRRHHCRRCGRVICGTCSQKLLIIPEISDRQPVRVCEDCYTQTRLENLQVRKESTASNASSNAIHIQWILLPNESDNDAIREEFYYHSAPSSSLCLSLLKMHSDKKRCAQVIIDHLTRPLFETFSSNRVDYGLIINLIKSLLLSAKVLLNEEESNFLPEIDFLLSRVDTVKMLVEENCASKDLISLVTVKDNPAYRLQEKLIEMERFDLAYHIATKYGINLKQIWKTWAMVTLKHGQFVEARKKFKPCFIRKSATTNDINSKLLQEIFDVFDTIKGRMTNIPLRDRCKAITLGQASNLLRKKQLYENEDCLLPQELLDEASYYLDNFGCKEDSIRFYVRFGFLKQALQIFLEEKNYKPLLPIFVSRLLLPVIKAGNLRTIFNLITSLDPTFNKSWKYWIYSCKYFSTNNYSHILYAIQIFMNDHIRAAMTQISFFLTPKATDYSQLFARLDNLMLAKQHCQNFLTLKDRLIKGCLCFTDAEVEKQIRLIDLQIEITRRFHKKKITLPQALTALQDAINNKSKDILSSFVPTILDDNIVSKTQIAVMVLLEYGNDICEGFTVAQQIIKNNELDAGQVYRLSGKILAKSSKVNLYQIITQLLECIRSNHDQDSLAMCDDVIGTILRHNPTLESADQLIKLLSDDINKIDAYIISGRLKFAFLLASNLHRVSDIKRILAASIRMKQDYVTKICQMWLNEKNA